MLVGNSVTVIQSWGFVKILTIVQFLLWTRTTFYIMVIVSKTHIKKWHVLSVINGLHHLEQVSDWWQQFVYLRSREPLIINSNYYGVVSISVIVTGAQLEP